MSISDVRRGDIGVALAKRLLEKEGIHLTMGLVNKVAEEADAMGIPRDEAWEFASDLIREFLNKVFAQTMPDKKG